MTTPHVYKKHIASRWFLEDFTRLHLTASCPTACCSALENISKNNESCVVFICLLNTCLSVWIVEKCSSQDFNSSIQKTSDPLPGLMPQNVATLVVVHGASFWIRWGFQALQGCPLSVASESKNCIQIRMVHEETYLKNDASITNQNKFTNFSGQKTLEMCLNLKWKEMFTTVYDWYLPWPHRQNNGSIPSCSCCIRSKNAEGSSPLKQPRSSSSQESSQISWWFRGWHCKSWQVDHTWKSEINQAIEYVSGLGEDSSFEFPSDLGFWKETISICLLNSHNWTLVN